MASSPPLSRPDGLGPRLLAAARHDQAAGVTLTLACGAALVWANWPSTGSYAGAWQTLAPWSHPLGLDLSWRDWVNQGLMLGFFALVGLEIRREVIAGELRSWRRASVPVLAALGGMAVPALLFTAVVAGGGGAHGWGIPVATDVAFALGTLALFGGGGWPRARVFLMTLAVADDIFSVVLLVVFYPGPLDGAWLGGALAALAAMGALAGLRLGRRWPGWLQLALGAAAWWALLHAGVEAAVVGIAVGALAPRSSPAHGPAGHGGHAGTRAWELRLTPFVNAAVLPAFALANSGLRFAGAGLGQPAALRVFVAVLVARVVGKPVGIYLTTRLVRPVALPRRPGGAPPEHLDRRRLVGVGATASVGFTVPLLIVVAALPAGPLRSAAIAALLAGSVIGAGLGAAVLVPTRLRARPR